ncbi:MAG: HIT family protein [Nanoarchaeota archaeon]|nr:HIT family protein [Nanoarchaeota archaeon]
MVNEIEEKLKGMSKEEIQELVKKQCLFCNIVNGNIESYKVYEDDNVMGVLDINPANKGHVILFPKEHLQFLNDLDEKLLGHLFDVVNKLSNKMIDRLKASGINIYIASGQGAGQNLPHIAVHVIPRYENDKIAFGWNPKKLNKNDFENITKELKTNKISKIEVKKVKKIKPKVVKAKKFEERVP